MDHDSIVADWQRNAEPHVEKNYAFLRSLKLENYGFSPDRLAEELHTEAFQLVDCTRCANCRKTKDIVLTDADIRRIARHLKMKKDDFIATYLERAEDDEGRYYQVRSKPCSFLGEDNRCTIYDVRPKVCAEYPHTQKRGFATRTHLHATNSLECPAVFWIVEQMKRQAHGRRDA